jgi:type IV pilus assembly protein PilQ
LSLGCYSDSTDLKEYIQKVKHRPVKPIEPIEKPKTISQFTFPQQKPRVNPFQPQAFNTVKTAVLINRQDGVAFKRPHPLKKNAIALSASLIQINYAKAADLVLLIQDKQNSLLSSKGKVTADSRTNTLWIQDEESNLQEVRRLIKSLDVPVPQVLIEARIVEVNKDFGQDMGIRWSLAKPGFTEEQAEGDNLPAADVPLNKRLNLDLVALPASLASPATAGIALARLGDGILLDLELSALESEGRAELISSPRLITTNQQAAVIESGQEIPYQELTTSGATSVSFKKAVLSLKVTPQITPDGSILMDLQINQDTPSHKTFNGVPAIVTKEIHTNVLVNNGKTIVLGGIYRRDKNKVLNRVPFLGELPILGALFRNTQISLRNDELLIFITPKIIENF